MEKLLMIQKFLKDRHDAMKDSGSSTHEIPKFIFYPDGSCALTVDVRGQSPAYVDFDDLKSCLYWVEETL